MRRKIILSIVGVLFVSGAIIGGYVYYWQGSPRYALYQMVRAIQKRDMETFFKYIELKEIFNNLIQEAGQDINIPPESGPDNGTPKDEWNRWSQRLGKKFARYLLPKLFATFEGQIKSQIEDYLLNLSTGQTLGLTALVAQAKIEQQHHRAQVTLTDPQSHQSLRFWMYQDPQTREWHIVEVNYQDLKNVIQHELQE